MAYWIRKNGKISGIMMPDLYGREREIGISSIMGWLTVEQIEELRSTLPVVDK